MIDMQKNLIRMSLACSTVVAVLAVTMGNAFAVGYTVPADPTGGAGDQTLSAAATWITTYGAPLVAGLLIIGIIFGVLVKFARRGARAA